MPNPIAAAVAFAVLLLAAGDAAAAIQAGPDNATKALKIVAATRTTRAAFAVYNWREIRRNGAAPLEEWSAEFHSGPYDRVETPRDRVVANCETMTGSDFSITSGETRSGSWAASAGCGIDANAPIIAAAWLGLVDTPCGKADRVQLTDAKFIRTYDIRSDGMIIETSYALNNPDRSPVLVDLAARCLTVLPGGPMFDDTSLRTSFVPDAQKRSPIAAH